MSVSNESKVTQKRNYPAWVQVSPLKQQYSFGFDAIDKKLVFSNQRIPTKKKKQPNPYENLVTIKPTVAFEKVEPLNVSDQNNSKASFLSSFKSSHVLP